MNCAFAFLTWIAKTSSFFRQTMEIWSWIEGGIHSGGILWFEYGPTSCATGNCQWTQISLLLLLQVRNKLVYTLLSKATGTSKTFIVSKVFIFRNPAWICLKAHNLPFVHAKFHCSSFSSLASTQFWVKMLWAPWKAPNEINS